MGDTLTFRIAADQMANWSQNCPRINSVTPKSRYPASNVGCTLGDAPLGYVLEVNTAIQPRSPYAAPAEW